MIAVTAVSMLPWPEMMTTGRSGYVRFMIVRTSRPSRRLPCSQMSRMTRCGFPILDGAQRFVAVAREARAVALILQDTGDQIPDIGFIIDDQNVSGHHCAPGG